MEETTVELLRAEIELAHAKLYLAEKNDSNAGIAIVEASDILYRIGRKLLQGNEWQKSG